MVEVCDFDPIFSEFVIRFQLALVNYALQMLDGLYRSCKLRRSEMQIADSRIKYSLKNIDLLKDSFINP